MYESFIKGILKYVDSEKIMIFGYNLNAENISELIKSKKDSSVAGYIVSSSSMMIEGKNMITIDMLNQVDKDIFIIFAAKRQTVRNEYIPILKNMGFGNIVLL